MRTICSRKTCHIADIAGVSRATVYRVINNDARISAATALKVRKAASQVGYEPRRVAVREGHRAKPRRPSSYRKMQVALISQVKPMLLETPVYSKLLRGIGDELGKINYNFIIRNLPEGNPEQAIPHKIDGAILFHVNAIQSNAKLFRELRRIPCVTVMGQAEEDEFFDHVTYNNRSIGKLSAEYLLSKGNKTFLFLGNRIPADNWFNLRGKDFISTVRKAGAKAYEIMADNLIDESHNMQLPNVKNFCTSIEKIRQLPELPTAIFVLADIYIAGLYHSLKHYDIIPGRDVEIVGVNNDSNMLNHLIPRPASVDIHSEEIGRKAVDRLLWRIENPKEPLGRILLEPEMAFS